MYSAFFLGFFEKDPKLDMREGGKWQFEGGTPDGPHYNNQSITHIIGKLSKFYLIININDLVTVWGISIFEKKRMAL